MDTLAPTREWQQKFRYDPPSVDQKSIRRAYRRISQAENLFRRDELESEQFKAAEKLNMHRLGAMGVKVAQGDECPLNADTEYPITYHNQKLALAEAAVANARAWQDMIAFVAEDKTVVEIGQGRGRTSHPVARAYALGRLQMGFDVLVDHWGLSTSRKQKIP